MSKEVAREVSMGEIRLRLLQVVDVMVFVCCVRAELVLPLLPHSVKAATEAFLFPVCCLPGKSYKSK